MVTMARAHTLAALTRASAHEAAGAEMQLATLGRDVWAVDARARLEARFAALETLVEELHQWVTEILDTLEASQAPRRRRTVARRSSTRLRREPAHSLAGSSRMPRVDSLSRLLMEQPVPRPQLQSPCLPVPAHGLGTAVTQAPPPLPKARVDPQQDVPSVPRPTRRTPMLPAEVAAQAQAGTLYTSVTLAFHEGTSAECTRDAACDEGTSVACDAACDEGRHALHACTSMVTPLMRAAPPTTVFLMPGVDIRYGPRRPSTSTQTTRRAAQAYGTMSATALARHGPPFYFEDGWPAGWKLVMGDLAADITATEARGGCHGNDACRASACCH